MAPNVTGVRLTGHSRLSLRNPDDGSMRAGDVQVVTRPGTGGAEGEAFGLVDLVKIGSLPAVSRRSRRGTIPSSQAV